MMPPLQVRWGQTHLPLALAYQPGTHRPNTVQEEDCQMMRSPTISLPGDICSHDVV